MIFLVDYDLLSPSLILSYFQTFPRYDYIFNVLHFSHDLPSLHCPPILRTFPKYLNSSTLYLPPPKHISPYYATACLHFSFQVPMFKFHIVPQYNQHNYSCVLTGLLRAYKIVNKPLLTGWLTHQDDSTLLGCHQKSHDSPKHALEQKR